MLTLIEVAAILAAGLFAGAAVYINLVEHPARMSLDTRHAARQWAPSYARATLMQAPLAVVGFFLGVCAWWQDHGTAWLAASLLIGAVVPFTLIVIMPTNRQLLDAKRDFDSTETRVLLQRWNWLHAVRSVLGLAAFAIAVGGLAF
jgi:hypothetical protein